MLRIGTRGTALALRQTEMVIEAARARGTGAAFETVVIRSAGDDAVVPAWRTDAPGVFTTTLSRALLDGRIDAAVHSLKDLPVDGHAGTRLVAILERADPADVLIDKSGRTLAAIPDGARVGTSSLRRRAQLLARRPRLSVIEIRGSVPARIEQVDAGKVDAIVIARAGVERLGLGHRATDVFRPEEWLPAPGQAAIAVEVRAGDRAASEVFGSLDHRPSRLATTIERSVLKALMAGCHAPVGAFSRARAGGVSMVAAAALGLDGRASLRIDRSALVTSEAAAKAFGRSIADALLLMGAGALLVPLQKETRHAG